MELGTENIKKEKVFENTLAKKERKPSKAQVKQSMPNNIPIFNKKEQNKTQDKIDGSKPDKQSSKPLSEKELRQLEWEKKLKQQKQTESENNTNLSKAELKAKRREQQEAQRLAKANVAAKLAKDITIKDTKKVEPNVETRKSPVKRDIKIAHLNRVQLVQHLYTETNSKYNSLVYKDVHSSFVRLGVQYSNKIILGSNARCLALLSALKQLISDLKTPPKQEFCRYLESVLQNCATYLHHCRPFAVSMTNALTHFKLQLTQVDTNKLSDNEKKVRLLEFIDTYINDDIKKAGVAISLKVNEKITNGDVILTYGCSSLIKKILLDAQKEGKKFEVIIIDGRPLLEGREMLRRLVISGIKCTYVLINAVSYIMSSVTKVLLGAHALLTNGYVMSRIGTAQVSLVAQAYNKPVLVCCETYKFSERVQTDSFVYNEIGEPDQLTSRDIIEETSPISTWKDNTKLTPLNLLYDVTPPDLVTAVVTELAILPCTSVPVVLRINANEAA